MGDSRGGFGAFVSALGAAVLAVSVFLPWYGVTLTASGAASAQQAMNSVAQQYGNASFQAAANTVGAGFGALAGRQLATISAHQLLKDISAILLIFAAVALLASLLRLAGPSAPIEINGLQIALAGIGATLCVAFRMVALPIPPQAYVTLTLTWGIWVALAGSVAIVIGGLWPAAARPATASPVSAFAGAQVEAPLPDLDAYWRG